MDENKEKKWSEISEEIADVSQNIKNKIEEEDVIDDLKESLLKFGYSIARRTVAKYRDQLNLPVARLRKKI